MFSRRRRCFYDMIIAAAIYFISIIYFISFETHDFFRWCLPPLPRRFAALFLLILRCAAAPRDAARCRASSAAGALCALRRALPRCAMHDSAMMLERAMRHAWCYAQRLAQYAEALRVFDVCFADVYECCRHAMRRFDAAAAMLAAMF